MFLLIYGIVLFKDTGVSAVRKELRSETNRRNYGLHQGIGPDGRIETFSTSFLEDATDATATPTEDAVQPTSKPGKPVQGTDDKVTGVTTSENKGVAIPKGIKERKAKKTRKGNGESSDVEQEENFGNFAKTGDRAITIGHYPNEKIYYRKYTVDRQPEYEDEATTHGQVMIPKRYTIEKERQLMETLRDKVVEQENSAEDRAKLKKKLAAMMSNRTKIDLPDEDVTPVPKPLWGTPDTKPNPQIPMDIEKASSPWSGQIKFVDSEGAVQQLCAQPLDNPYFYRGAMEAQSSLGDGAVVALSWGCPDMDKYPITWTLVPQYFPSEEGYFLYSVEFNNTGLWLAHSTCDSPLGSTKVNRDCYLAFQKGTAPLLLTGHKPGLFEFQLVPPKSYENADAQQFFIPSGVYPNNPVLQMNWALDMTNKFIRRRPFGGNQIMEVSFEPPLYCEWSDRNSCSLKIKSGLGSDYEKDHNRRNAVQWLIKVTKALVKKFMRIKDILWKMVVVFSCAVAVFFVVKYTYRGCATLFRDKISEEHETKLPAVDYLFGAQAYPIRTATTSSYNHRMHERAGDESSKIHQLLRQQILTEEVKWKRRQ